MKNSDSEKKVQFTPQSLYETLCSDQYAQRPYERKSLGDEMSIVSQVIGEFWKPRFLMDDRNKTAFEFMNGNEELRTVRTEDIDWLSLKHLPDKAVERARNLDAHFPTMIYAYRDGAAKVSWELNPDGQYYMDEDGFGMTDDEEISIYGVIDRTGKVIEKFHYKG